MNKTLRPLIFSALLAAISMVLFLLQASTPLTPAFLKLDISDLPALIASLFLGAPYGVLVCLVKNALGLFHSMTGGIGELSNFLLSSIFVLTVGFVYKKRRSQGNALLATFLGALAMAAFSFPSNLFLVYPVYTKIMSLDAIMGMYSAILPSVNRLWQALLIFNVPFTFVKAMLSFVLMIPLYPLLRRLDMRK
ncbi:MAG: ECF transporter S component [Oscillospiraceae bacterium]|nr:ECF transporter S component [Oscillospiraceae bacterium]